jgi:hypothetical protein
VPPLWRAATNVLNKQSRTADKGWRLGRSHSLSELLEANNLLSSGGNLIPYRPVRNLVTTLTEIPRLCELQCLIRRQSKQSFSVQIVRSLEPKSVPHLL